MKIGILTFHCAVNYGAVLQAFGLKETLLRLGHDVHVIDYCPEYLISAYSPWQNRPGLRSLAHAFGWSFWYRYLKINFRKSKRNRKFKNFIHKYLALDSKFFTGNTKNYDAIICGSDQIWNPNITGGNLDEVYFGKLPNCGNAKRLAYGASVGGLKHLTGYEDKFSDLLKEMSDISVREKNLAEFIHRLQPSFSIETVADPTILAGREIFDNIASKRLIKKPYLLFFNLNDDALLREKASRIAREKNFEFLEVSTYHDFLSGQKLFRPASPSEFCSLFKYADHIVTDSFHGTAFSILFEKNFEVFINKAVAPDRMSNLLSALGLESRMLIRYSEFEERQDNLMSLIDYTSVNKRLEAWRLHSLGWLKNSLEK